MAQAAPRLLTFDEFVARYGDNERYELIDGELIDIEPKRSAAAKRKSHHLPDIQRVTANG